MKNIKVHFVTRNGETETVEVPEYNILMEASRYHSKAGYIDKIDADRGGACSCATCHVKVRQDWLDKTGKATESEQDLLELESAANEQSRLSCQIEMTDELDGLVVEVIPL